jgi:hypothetical protein
MGKGTLGLCLGGGRPANIRGFKLESFAAVLTRRTTKTAGVVLFGIPGVRRL